MNLLSMELDNAASAKLRNVNGIRSDEYRVSYVEFKSSTSLCSNETEIMSCGARYMCRSLVWSVMHFVSSFSTDECVTVHRVGRRRHLT
jgi:hypothetical protein